MTNYIYDETLKDGTYIFFKEEDFDELVSAAGDNTTIYLNTYSGRIDICIDTDDGEWTFQYNLTDNYGRENCIDILFYQMLTEYSNNYDEIQSNCNTDFEKLLMHLIQKTIIIKN